MYTSHTQLLNKAEKIKKLRIDRNAVSMRIIFLQKLNRLSGKEIADAIGVSPQVFSSYVREEPCLPSVEKLLKLAKLFNVSVEYLLLGEKGNEKDSQNDIISQIESIINN